MGKSKCVEGKNWEMGGTGKNKEIQEIGTRKVKKGCGSIKNEEQLGEKKGR